MLGVLTVAASVVFAPNVLATEPDNGPTYNDRDGDGLPDNSDPCPDNPATTCTSQKCGTTTITGDGSSFTGASCQYEYNGANPVQCPDGTYAPTSADCSTRGTGSDGTGGGGGSGGGNGGGGGGGSQEATPAPAPPSLAAAQGNVEACAAAKPGYRNVMDMAKEEAGRRGLRIVVESGPLPGNTMGYLSCRGREAWDGRIDPSSITMTIDEANIRRAVASRRGTSRQTEYMHLFAELLLHEYQHALDCAIGRLPVRTDGRLPDYFEFSAERAASRDYRELFGTTSPKHEDYNHTEHGSPDCI